MRRRFTTSKSFNTDKYLTITALDDNLTVSFTNNVEYNINGGEWNTIEANVKTPPIVTGDTISFRGEITPTIIDGCGTFTIDKECKLSGNAMSLMFKDNANNISSLYGYVAAFTMLFYNCTTIISVSDNFLPATTLSLSCYEYMFFGCANLKNTPKLPATTLTNNCYYNMFGYCTSLVNASELPATTLADGCYEQMFRGCTKLNYIKMLATDISASYCLYGWVGDVASSGTFIKNPAMNSLPTGYSGIPEGWTVVNDGEESGGNLITFTINGTQHQAEEGMTWGEWVDSEYNVINASIHQQSNGLDYISLGIEQGNPNVIHDSSFFPVLITNEIIANHSYNVILLGGGGV